MSKTLRYVVTHVNKYGMRVLTFAAQGRNTYATFGEAREQMEACTEGLKRVIGEATATLEVRACECWPGHFDPKGIYFD